MTRKLSNIYLRTLNFVSIMSCFRKNYVTVIFKFDGEFIENWSYIYFLFGLHGTLSQAKKLC